ncbi:MAG TPA: hypothetical protein VMT76_12055 [Puia sp.]|nr:hypothetical protein [Puia sp.]
MQTSQEWVSYFQENLEKKRINWQQPARITKNEVQIVLKSLQAWQLGETSDGTNLLKASSRYAENIGDPYYIKAVKLFINEEQKHGNNLGMYLDIIGEPRINKNWGDTLFRKIRYLNNSMEWWTLAVISVESTAQIFYQSLKDATGCQLLKEICTDILIDEAPHIRFQQERLWVIFHSRHNGTKNITYHFYKFFFMSTSVVVWVAHRKLFKAGGNDFSKYYRKMKMKCAKIIGRLKYGYAENYVPQPLQ